MPEQLTESAESERALALHLIFKIRRLADSSQGWTMVGEMSRILADCISRETMTAVLTRIDAMEVEHGKQIAGGIAAPASGDVKSSG